MNNLCVNVVEYLATTNCCPRNTEVILLVELNLLSVESAVNKGI